MASKLYPPILEASIPAFYGNKVAIPFAQNPLVSNIDYQYFTLQVKKINSELIGVYTSYSYNKENNIVYFDLGSDLGENPNWYKFQLAYNNGQVGYYSTVAIGRFLGKDAPTLQLVSNYTASYQAVYSHPNDLQEKAYSFHFVLKNEQDEIIEDLGEQIHDINKDEDEDTAIAFFEFRYNPQASDHKYFLYCTVKTINGLILSTSIQINDSILSGVSLDENLDDIFIIETSLNREDGTVELAVNVNRDKNPSSLIGQYVIKRTSSKDNYLRISTVSYFSLCVTPDLSDKSADYRIVLLEDKTVEAGYYYNYYIQRYNNNGVYSETIGNAKYPIYVSFDNCFLFDGERQLCIQYNPKISSFKTDIQQAKTEAIGSKYPFIMRNGVINYKEFPISGLISFNMDKNHLFMMKEDKERLGIIPDHAMRGKFDANTKKEKLQRSLEKRRITKTIQRGTPQNLVDINISAEKEFKLMVLDFLNSPKPKLFRSATEGNYCVYTMNSSLSPNDILGRMLHTFSCTAYEIMDIEDFYKQLIIKEDDIYDSDGNLLSIEGIESQSNLKTKTLTYTNLNEIIGKNLLQYNEFVRHFSIRDANPLVQCRLTFINLANPSEEIADQIITIGSTGSYNYFTTSEHIYINGIYILSNEREPYNSNYIAFILSDYITIDYNDFDYIKDYEIEDSLGNQLFADQSQEGEQIISYLEPATIDTNNSVIRNKINKLRLFRVENRNESEVEYAQYCFTNHYQINQELAQVKEEIKKMIDELSEQDIIKLYLSEELALYIMKSFEDAADLIHEMSIDEQAKFLQEKTKTFIDAKYIFEATSDNEIIEDIIEDDLDFTIGWETKLVPPQTTLILALNREDVPNIVIKYDNNNKDLFYEVSCNTTSVEYNYGG